MPYVKPGVYIAQKYLAGGVNNSSVFKQVIVGEGLSTQRVWSEPVIRGGIVEIPTVSTSGTSGKFFTVESNTRKYADTQIYKDGALIPSTSDVFTFDAVSLATSANGIVIMPAYYNANSVYTVNYVAPSVATDTLANTPTNVNYVSYNSDGSRFYTLGVDYSTSGDTVNWGILTKATATAVTSTFSIASSAGTLKVAVDNLTPMTVTFTPAISATSGLVSEFNSAATSAWGSAYSTVASNVGGFLTLNSVVEGRAGAINFFTVTNDAASTLFNVTSPVQFNGTGVRPDIGSTYYVRYDMTRPSSAYNVTQDFFSYDEAFLALGPMNESNDILIAIDAAYKNGANVISTVLVEDANGDGVYNDADWFAALDALKQDSSVTDLCLLSTSTTIKAYAAAIIEQEASLTTSHFMTGWFGMAKDAAIGNVDTAGTPVYEAQKTFRMNPASAGRGRCKLAYPVLKDTNGIGYTITNTDTRLASTLRLDSTYLATALCSLQLALEPISESLLRRSIVGFNTDNVDINENKASMLAENGVLALLNSGGKLIVFDPVTCDSGDEIFTEVNISYQKDYLATKIKNRLNANVVGVVPDSLDDFISIIKTHISQEIEAAVSNKIIAPYTSNGIVRKISLDQDIKVYRSQTSKTEYRFTYWFNARYTAKRLFGEYTIDQPII